MTEANAIAVIALWDTRKFCTAEIATLLNVREAARGIAA